MKPRSLARLLARQWMLFTVGMSVLFATAALLLMFLLEDDLIDRRLRAVAAEVSEPVAARPMLSAEFHVYPLADVPLDIHARVPFAREGRPFELRRASGRHAHVLIGRTSGGESFAVVYDVTDEMGVVPGLGRGMAITLALTAMVLAIAYAMARTFIRRVSIKARALADEVRRSPHPDHLRQLAARQDVSELGDLLALHADVWAGQLMAVERERQTLAFLGHELRTPLQSARTSLVLLQQSHEDAEAWARMERAVARLVRASTAILWLATDRQTSAGEGGFAACMIKAIVTELQPLARLRKQSIQVTVPDDLAWQVPAEVAEAILGNLLLNAIQHGQSGNITLHADRHSLTLSNLACDPELAPPGFGIGLKIVQRLAERIGWDVIRHLEGQMVLMEIRFQPGEAEHGCDSRGESASSRIRGDAGAQEDCIDVV